MLILVLLSTLVIVAIVIITVSSITLCQYMCFFLKLHWVVVSCAAHVLWELEAVNSGGGGDSGDQAHWWGNGVGPA